MAVTLANSLMKGALWSAVLLGLGVKPALGAPKYHCAEPIFYFGEADNSGVLEHSFEIQNQGDSPLRISAIRTTCGCTVAQMDDDVIPRGGKGVLTGALNLTGRKGLQHNRIYFATNDPAQPWVFLAFQGTATQEIDITPEFVSFGRIDGVAAEEREITVKRLKGVPLKLLGFAEEDCVFRVEVVSGGGAKDTETVMRIHVPAGVGPGTHKGTLLIDTSKGKRSPHEVGVTAWVMDAVTVLPTKLTLFEGQGPSTRFVMLSPGKVEEYRVLGVDLPGNAKATVKEVDKGRYRIEITGLEGRAELDGKAVTIRTDVPTRTRIEIPIRILPAK